MSEFFDPYNADRPLMLKCSCGRDHTLADHHAETQADAAAAQLRARSETSDFEAYSQSFIEATLVNLAVLPQGDAGGERAPNCTDGSPCRLVVVVGHGVADARAGRCGVQMPDALERKYPRTCCSQARTSGRCRNCWVAAT